MIDMDALLAKTKAKRGPECISRDGSCHATPEVAAWWNELLDFHDAGKPAGEAEKLEVKRIALRKQGHNI